MILEVLSFAFLLSYSTAIDCTLPSNSVVEQLLKDEVTSGGGEGSTTTIRGGPYYVCQVQGTTMGTYQELSVIMEYTFGGTDRVGQFEMICQASPDGWGRRSESLIVLSSSPGVTYDGSIGLRTNCSSCINTAGNDNNCVACHSSCNNGLMKCTGSTSDDCCVAFEEDLECKTDLDCTTNNFIANAQNNFTCACGLSCSVGYSLNSTSCTCTLTDICVADNPCNNNGSCVLGSSPDQYTCNCTGTEYIGTNCSVCPECPMAGYSLYSSNCSCYPSHICLLDNPCNNGGNCMIQEGDSNYTCACTGNYGGTNCTDCYLDCPSGYVAETDCTECVLDDICVADNPCNNGGVCILDTVPDQYTCNCTGTGYTGTNCSVCSLNCNSGTPSSDCSSCNCGMMYTGHNCETELDYCNGVDCFDHGTCSNNYVNMVAECNCYNGWAGPTCDECGIDNCRECVPNGQQADCVSCIEGYASSGSSCVPQEVCPCRNNGICISTQDGSYRCNCSRPWTGDNCTECVKGYGKQDNRTGTYCLACDASNCRNCSDDYTMCFSCVNGYTSSSDMLQCSIEESSSSIAGIIVSSLLGVLLFLIFIIIIVYVVYAFIVKEAVKKRQAKIKAAKAFGESHDNPMYIPPEEVAL